MEKMKNRKLRKLKSYLLFPEVLNNIDKNTVLAFASCYDIPDLVAFFSVGIFVA
jgi:hypothetical protein